jgi:hypothetical protein
MNKLKRGSTFTIKVKKLRYYKLNNFDQCFVRPKGFTKARVISFREIEKVNYAVVRISGYLKDFINDSPKNKTSIKCLIEEDMLKHYIVLSNLEFLYI